MQLQSKKSITGNLGLTMIACIWAVCAPAPAAARTIYVAEPGQGGHVLPFTNWVDAATNIQSAIDEAGNGDTVLISNGTYYLDGQILVSANKTNVCIRGFSGAPEDVVIDAHNFSGKPVTNRCMIVNGNQIRLEALTFTNGRALGPEVWDRYGGGLLIQNSGKTSHVDNCRFVGNSALYGGGVGLIYGTVTLRDCLFLDNVASNNGGGIYVYAQVDPGILMEGGIIEGNRTGGKGGGIYVQGSAAYAVDRYQFAGTTINSNEALDSGGGVYCLYSGAFSNAFFNGNAASNNGGGLYFYYGGLVQDSEINANQAVTNYGGGAYHEYGGRITASELRGNSAIRGGGVYIKNIGEIFGSILQENTAADGGGIYLYYGGLARGCLLAGNNAVRGGGIFQYQWTIITDTTMVESCTIVSNTAATEGGGLWLRDNDPYTVKNYNNIIWFNTMDSGTSSNVYNYTWLASNDFYHCAVPTDQIPTGQGNRTDDPKFASWTGGDFRLADGSPCINAGTNLPWMSEPGAVDAEGRQRLDRFSRLADIGCYEYVPKGMMFWLH